MSAPGLTCQDLTITVPGRTLVAGLELEVRTGSFLGILGRNGSGKTTTLHTLCGLRPQQNSRVFLDGKPIGYAVFFYNYSTWLGKNGLYLEDLYITRKHRGCGAGKAALRYLAKLAVDQGCGRFEWSVLDWNEPAIQFYRSIHAKPQNDWVLYRLDGEALADFAGS